MKFRATYQVYTKAQPAYYEDEDRPEVQDLDQARDWAEKAVRDFNESQAPHERQIVVKVEPLPDGPDVHDWVKTNTEPRSNGIVSYDNFRCNKCGITGVKYGSAPITVDSEYQGIEWSFCSRVPEMLNQLEKRRRKRERRKNRVRMK